MMAQNTVQPAISVQGEGTVKVVPDQVTLNLSVEHSGKNLLDIKSKNDASVAAVLKQLTNLGVQAKDIQTQRVNLNRSYDYNTKEYNFKAQQSITVLLRDLSRYDRVITALLQEGLNRIDGLHFGSSKMEQHLSEARAKAVQNARQKAQEYSGALGQSIGKALQISEPGQGYNPMPVLRMAKMESAMMDSGGQETLAAGEMEISVQVTVVFELK